jgi:steroid delta-isomerase-like uncharacterized protein
MPTDTDAHDTVRRFYEATGDAFGDLLAEALADEITVYDPHLADGRGRDRVERYYASWNDAFPDIEFTVDDLFAVDDRVAVRWTAKGTHEAAFWGVAPTGNEMHLSGIDVVRLADGRIGEVWTVYDSATLLQQLDVELPVAPPTGER